MTVRSLDRVDLERLSPQSRWALEKLAVPHRLDDADLADLAEHHEISVRVARRMLNVLDAEVRAQQFGGELPGLARAELEALEMQLLRWGQVYPVVRAIPQTTRQPVVVDGANRAALLDKLELPVSYVDVDVADEEEARTLGLALNLARRHLDPKRIRSVVSAEILHDPKRSDRAIAELLGVSHVTVGKARKELQKLGVVETVTTRVGKDGVEQRITPTTQAAPRREERLTAILSILRDLGKADNVADAHAEADRLVAEVLRLFGAGAIADAFTRVVTRS